jgi:hypothetical protein
MAPTPGTGRKMSPSLQLQLTNIVLQEFILLSNTMYGKNHTKEALALISKPGELNPMFGRKHSEETKTLIRKKMSKQSMTSTSALVNRWPSSLDIPS